MKVAKQPGDTPAPHWHLSLLTCPSSFLQERFSASKGLTRAREEPLCSHLQQLLIEHLLCTRHYLPC